MKKICVLLAAICLFVSGISVTAGTALAAKTAAETQAATVAAEKIDINTADEAKLITLPGIGEKTAAAITSFRKENGNFKSLDELEQIKGIGPKKLAKLRPYLQEI